MEALIVDGGTRLLKTAAACSCSIALYSSLPPSPVLALRRSLCFLFENSPAPLFPLRSSVLGNRRVAWSARVQKARVYSSSPGGACRRRWTDGLWRSPTPNALLGLLAFKSTQRSADFLRHNVQVHTRAMGPRSGLYSIPGKCNSASSFQ